MNPYAYCDGNPVTAADPLGLRPSSAYDMAVLHNLYQYGLENNGKGVAQQGLMHAVNGAIASIKAAIARAPLHGPASLSAAEWAVMHMGDANYGNASVYHGDWSPASGSKCNYFVADSYTLGAGLGIDGSGVPSHHYPFHIGHIHPYTANEMGDASVGVPHFPVTGSPAVGDVCGFFAPGGIGHATINLGGGLLIYATNTSEGSVKLGTVQGVRGAEDNVWPTYRHFLR